MEGSKLFVRIFAPEHYWHERKLPRKREEEVFIREEQGVSFPHESQMKISSSADVAAGARAINAPGLAFEQTAEAYPHRASKIVFPSKNRVTFRLYSTPNTVRGRESENTVANMC